MLPQIASSEKTFKITVNDYANLERLLSYSKKKQNAEDFAKKAMGKIKVHVKKNRAQTLKEFINQKKVKMLTEDSKEEFNDALIEGLLSSDKTRHKLFLGKDRIFQNNHFFHSALYKFVLKLKEDKLDLFF